jgi:hypothetical protein
MRRRCRRNGKVSFESVFKPRPRVAIDAETHELEKSSLVMTRGEVGCTLLAAALDVRALSARQQANH